MGEVVIGWNYNLKTEKILGGWLINQSQITDGPANILVEISKVRHIIWCGVEEVILWTMVRIYFWTYYYYSRPYKEDYWCEFLFKNMFHLPAFGENRRNFLGALLFNQLWGVQKRGGINVRVGVGEGHKPNGGGCCTIGGIWQQLHKWYSEAQIFWSWGNIWRLVLLASLKFIFLEGCGGYRIIGR